MAIRAQYFGAEILNNAVWTAPQRATLVSALQGLPFDYNGQPASRNHWRVRLDNLATIFEAKFDDDNLTIAKFKDYLGSAFGVAPATISHSTASVSYSTGNSTVVVTFTYNAVTRLRAAMFGGPGASWVQSHNEALGYIAANLAAWQDQ